MSECLTYFNELKDLVRKWVPDEDTYVEQKTVLLSQVNFSSIVTEGLKLLSTLIEVDSCVKHGCIHNRSKTVNQILYDHRIVGPTLPDVVPDGYRVSGSTLILLETFVRVNQESFECKYRHDFEKLMQLSKDLAKCGLTLVPVIDGRSSYYIERLPDWVIERMRWLLLRIMSNLRDSGEKIEEMEYERLVHSLSNMENQNLGLESLASLREEGLDYKTRLTKTLKEGIYSNMTTSECRVGIAKLYDHFCLLRDSGQYEDVYTTTSRSEMITWLKTHELVQMSSSERETLIEAETCKFCQIHMYAVLKDLVLLRKGWKGSRCRDANEILAHKSLLSDCNKIKGLKVLNTRRNTLLCLDIIVLNSLINLIKLQYTDLQYLINNHFKSVNDRLVSVDLIINKLDKKLTSDPNWLCKLRTKIGHKLKIYDLDHVISWLRPIEVSHWYEFKLERDNSGECVKPTIKYKKSGVGDCQGEDCNKDVITDDSTFSDYLDALSTLSMGLMNSMKTSSATKLVVNDERNYFGTVQCDECYFQDLDINYGTTLIYQKTGERTRCYGLMSKEGGGPDVYKVGKSFYADPKRYFLPIMSSEVILKMCREMLSWLDWLSEKEMMDVRTKLYTLVISILTVPSKRVQIYLQGFRYFIMAYVNEFHVKELVCKLKVKPLTRAELSVFTQMDDLVALLLTGTSEEHMTKSFKFILNLSYLCHLITKETPDRLTDQIKCFEKFLEPKLTFNSVILNLDSSPQLTEGTEEKIIGDLKKLFSKDLGVLDLKEPGVSKEVLSLCSSCFNNGMLSLPKVLSRDPQSPSFTSTALDISSNKSVVVPKLNEVGETITQYDYQSLLSSVVVEMAQSFKDKLRFKLDRRSLQYAIYKRLTNMVSKNEFRSKDDPNDSGILEDIEDLVDEGTHKLINEIEANVSDCLSKMSSGCNKSNQSSKGLKKFEKVDLLQKLWSREYMSLILSETSFHEVKDFDPSLLPSESYQEMCDAVYDSVYRNEFFTEKFLKLCPLELLIKNLATKHYEEGDYFECFKYLLIGAGCDNRVGRFDHRSRARLGFKDTATLVKEESRISSRESNSEAISKRLDKSFFTNSSLRNLCFYSEESPTYRSSVSSSVGKLKFGLSYKEQVGSNRELYIGDLNTKLTSRLIEDYFESLTSECRFSCLNNDSEFERALLDMKSVVRLSGLAVSLDHSKWGPYMSPAIFNALFSNLDLQLKDGGLIDKSPIENLLNWHLHKIVEVPYNVVEAYLKGYTKRSLGLMDRSSSSMTEDYFFRQFAKGVVPSHITSVLDMGQGILHNASDYYGLLTEQFITLCLELCFDVKMTAYTSSDDEIMLSNSYSLKRESDDDLLDMEKCKEILEFHYYLSSKLNKFISPKTVAGSFASEFKSRFFIWSQEVPLLTKFVAAALHNVKAKSPHQLAETIDTILDQCAANGVSIEIINELSKRTNRLISYSGHPVDPFLCVFTTDLKDWVDGSRGYRLQRSIESIINSEEILSTIRDSCRQLFYMIRSGRIQEEYLISALQSSPDDCLRQMLKITGTNDSLIEEALTTRWLNLRAFGDLRLVLRTKIMTGTRILDKEEVPSLIKSVQSKLSKNFVRGAKKIITDAINKSAFQSSICSGFIGLCKSMGSKCVRDGSGGFIYIKDLLKKIDRHTNCEVCCPLLSVFCEHSLRQVAPYSRPLLWDYFSLTFSNACELGNWVFSKVELPRPPLGSMNPNFFWPVKPGSHSELEDKVNMNHVLYSIKRNFPDLFDEHIAPFLSDLNSLKVSWVQRIKFLDLCVAMDMSSECLGIISHIMRKRREELYIVKQEELSVCHIRESCSLEKGLQLNSVEICQNFLTQLLFESMLNPVLLSTSQFKKYFWYGEVEFLPNDADHDLGQLTQFIMDCKLLNISRCMCLDDLDVGYVHSKIELSQVFINLSTFINLVDWENRESYQSFDEVLIHSNADHIPLEIGIILSHTRKSFKFRYERKTNYYVKCGITIQKSEISSFSTTLSDGFELHVEEIDCYVSGSEGDHISLDGVGLVPLHPLFSGKEALDLNKLLSDQDIEFKQISLVFSKVKLDFKDHVKDLKNKFSYKLQGPEQGLEPLHLDKGQIMERNTVVSRLEVPVTSRSLFLALEALDPGNRPRFLSSLHEYMRKRPGKKDPCFVRMTQQDLCLLVELYEAAFMQVLSAVSDWIEFGCFALCFSKTLNCIMIADDGGDYRLKGRPCKTLSAQKTLTDIE
ncbi:RNA-dependent RNA polymerase [Mammarenavirus tamiamiense]|uniref:RNA-directed RNA polymerase L n=2 Tax=Tamiami mammarenavirus (isolate Rat/United States/W 10777/1964) TaxID=3052329 RepID=L_TAMVU|nr:RNA-dependent RNA polymerase [Mammarenavirus tamiamiense]A9JR23.1 RecName: Full=RNA-directed RNA polymerase L; Short=Protein L; AltName: Full=Large structural protein; AltName: Full=Replicase; AltName: Full=Transcriptase; Includes: RecName: Full=cap-snatching endonuclease [Mammarenavirus tamiamiense]AAX99349.1 RNA-dependent RNA polymerase [Mammarenavirus tamiamiense]